VLRLEWLEEVFGRDIDRVLERPVNRTLVGMEVVDALHDLSVLLVRLERIRHVNSANHEHPVILSDLASYGPAEPSFTCTDPARLQRASEGPR
jgi:hypothetical protein